MINNKSQHKVIKSVATKSFYIDLVQTGLNTYSVIYGDRDGKDYEAKMDDLKYALKVFDDVLIELEGN